MQETFLRVYRAAPTYRPQAAFTTWLYRLVVNLCWDQRRRIVREKRLRVSLASEPAATESNDAEQRDRSSQVRDAVMALPDRQRLGRHPAPFRRAIPSCNQ